MTCTDHKASAVDAVRASGTPVRFAPLRKIRIIAGENAVSRRFHFISGLPRSGSTLLGAVLAQNPGFHAGMSSPLGGMFEVLLKEMSVQNEFSVLFGDGVRRRVLRGLFDNYYADREAAVVFDTNRIWCAHMPALRELFPEARVIGCVRDLPWVVDSIERVIRQNSLSPSSIFDHMAHGTVYTRANGLTSSTGLVGYAYDALKQAYYGEQADRLILVQYETLARDPEHALRAIYDFIGEPYFGHDFERVEFDDRGFDARIGTPGLHHVRSRVSPRARTTLLPPDLFNRLENLAFWGDPEAYRRGVRIV